MYTPPSHISTVNQPHAVGDHVCPVAGYQTAVLASHQLGRTRTNAIFRVTIYTTDIVCLLPDIP